MAARGPAPSATGVARSRPSRGRRRRVVAPVRAGNQRVTSMQKNTRGRWGLRAWLGAVALVALSSAQAETIRVLQVTPLTGVDGGAGWHVRLGALVAFEEANAADPARSLQLVTLDEQPGAVAEQVREGARRTQAVALFGLFGRNALAELLKSPVPAELGLPVVGVQTGMALPPREQVPWLFVTRGGFADELDGALRQVGTIGGRRVAVLTTDDADGDEIDTLARRAAATHGLELAPVLRHLHGSARVEAAAEQLAGRELDAIVLASNTAAVAHFAKLYRKAGGRAQLIALSSAEATQLARVVGAEAARGLMVSQVVPNPRDPKIALMREFQAAYRRFGPADLAPTLIMTEAYVSARLLIDAIRRSGPAPTRATLQRSLAGLPGTLQLGGVPLSLHRAGTAYRSLSMIDKDGQLIY